MYIIPSVMSRSLCAASEKQRYPSVARAFGWLAFSWLMNFVGALFTVYFIAYLGTLLLFSLRCPACW